ncbi:hypothetical protein J6590_070155 [Homalodisca vitripennis]|nr:hypothetical protein J6590_070155 [Homalodisca vitripennis]
MLMQDYKDGGIYRWKDIVDQHQYYRSAEDKRGYIQGSKLSKDEKAQHRSAEIKGCWRIP